MNQEKSEVLYKNQFVESIIQQLKKTRKLFFITLISSGVLFACLIFISITAKIPVSNFTRDPMQIVNAPFYTGLLTNIGILFWTSTTAMCFLSFSLLYKVQFEKALFFLLAGCFTLLLLLDDFFLFHEVVYRNYLLIPQKVVFIGYAAGLIFLIIRFKNTILNTEFLLLLAAIIFFIISGAFDSIPQNIFPFHHIFEDGFKFLGILFWFLYFTKLSHQTITNKKTVN